MSHPHRSSNVVHIAGPDTSEQEAHDLAKRLGTETPALLLRRGTALGWIARKVPTQTAATDPSTLDDSWRAGTAILLPGLVRDALPHQQEHIADALALMEYTLDGGDIAERLAQPPYAARLTPRFEMLSSFQDEGDPQEIETVEFDAVEHDEIVGENLWVKASWLSFDEEDASLRFRFSFGMVGYEDVAADPARQRHAAALTEAVFPESAVISANPAVARLLQKMLAVPKLDYVERIVYFNAPNGGAQFHHDVERGHLGVVFAQLHGRTGWLALAKPVLMDEIQTFLDSADAAEALEKLLPPMQREELLRRAAERSDLNGWLDDADNDPLELLLNHCPAFTRQLVERGHAYILEPGDVILLPQKDIDSCCWHTVFCLDDHAGEALSFAVRAA